ncbi:hypothetical protein GCM10010449_05270 [Streptomyces rectiviolaceus]|uniref:Transposase n=1 Tax=Streptomyces rectiviolaceus TaxID=332591 RepID=A0ABP6M8Q8_9ACTN
MAGAPEETAAPGDALDAYRPLIDQMLRVDLDAPRKQRHTVKRIFDRLLDEHAAEGVTYPMVRAYVADRRPQIKVEAGRGPVNAFIPQTQRPRAEAGRTLPRADPGRHRGGVTSAQSSPRATVFTRAPRSRHGPQGRVPCRYP